MRHEFEYEPIGSKYYPIVPLLVGIGGAWAPISAMVDSGATLSILNAGIARALGIKVDKGQKIELSGIGGKVSGYLHRLRLNINGSEFEAEVAFTDELSVPMNLLGRKDVFEKFSITFNDKTKKVVLEGI